MRSRLLLLAATTLAGLAVGCFEDPGQTCTAGSQDCECSENLECEVGLICTGATCQPDGETGDGDGESTDDGESTGDGDGDGDTDIDGTDTTDTSPDPCGNGMLEPDEMCDGGPGCTDCVLDNYDCNPINNVGCVEGTKCSYVPPNYELKCLVFDPNPPLQWGEENCYNFEPKDQACDLGLSCTPGGSATNQCEDGACCTWYCSLLEPDFDCGTPGDTCVKFFIGDQEPAGLEWLGFCSNLGG